MSKLNVSIVVDDAHLSATESIARELSAHGMRVERVVAEVGAIYASGEAADIAWARRLEGVLEVEPEREVRLPPLDGRVPQ